ncbi:MAG: glycogen-binding domain-containing protein [Gemmatimonadota bacterium]|nr:glycogen-binding domain-containing protein [Gemmatimonadota bacterium]
MSEDRLNIRGPGPDETAMSMAADAFAQRVGRALRRAESAPPELAASVMRAVAGDGESGSRSQVSALTRWWTRPRPLSLSPLAGLALAAGFAGIVALGALGVSRSFGSGGPVVATARTDTLHLVRFVFVDPTASRVALAGDFNGWSAEARPLTASGENGIWSVTIPLGSGRYEYAFVVDGKRWVADPFAARVSDEFGGESSVIRLDGGGFRTM